MLLSIITFLPLIGALVLALLPREQRDAVKWVAFLFASQTFVLSLSLGNGLGGESATAGYFASQQFGWIESIGATYHLAADGFSWLLVVLTTLLTTICVAASFGSVKERQKEYYAFLLALETGVIGTFLALDMALFYVFWELMLIPLYFLIGMFGSKNRIYATMKFVIFTFAGSVLMLIAILYIYAKTGEGGLAYTSNLPEILSRLDAGTLSFSHREGIFLFLGFFVAFAIKIPLFPLHTWLPDAHTEAPTAGSVMLAGVLLKTGAYGIIRFCLPLFPEAALALQSFIMLLAVIAILYGALGAIAQEDMKRLVAYSSISHMGFIVLGIFAFNQWGMTGAMLQMINHGLSTSGLFLCVGMLYERRHTRELSEYGGLAAQTKWLAIMAMIMLLSSVGLPLLNGFVGEYWILVGSFQVAAYYTGFAALGVVLGAVYLLKFYRGVFFGELDEEKNGNLPDLSGREFAVLAPLVILIFWIGIYSPPFTKLLEPASDRTVVAVLGELPERPGGHLDGANLLETHLAHGDHHDAGVVGQTGSAEHH